MRRVVNKFAFEASDRTLRDIMRFSQNSLAEKSFGDKTVVLGGDFQKILLIIPRASREDIVFATINSYRLWSHRKVLRLNKNMRYSTTDPILKDFTE